MMAGIEKGELTSGSAGAVGIVKCVKLPSLGTGDDCKSPLCSFARFLLLDIPSLRLFLQTTTPISSSGTSPRRPSRSWPPASRPSAFSSAKRPPPAAPPTSAVRASRSSRSPSAPPTAAASCLTASPSNPSGSRASKRARYSRAAGQAGTEVLPGLGVGMEAGVEDVRLRRIACNKTSLWLPRNTDHRHWRYPEWLWRSAIFRAMFCS